MKTALFPISLGIQKIHSPNYRWSHTSAAYLHESGTLIPGWYSELKVN